MGDNIKERWQRVTQQHPCPVCGHSDWCAFTPDGNILRCMRDGEAPNGMKLIANDHSGGRLFELINSSPSQNGSAKRGRASKAAFKANQQNLDTLQELHCTQITPKKLDELAAQLRVTAASVDALDVGWAERGYLLMMKASGKGWNENRPDGAFAFPERDGGGKLVGFSYRTIDGRKGSPSGEVGAKRGLIVPPTIHDGSDQPVLIVEDASDVAACFAMGLHAVGRPSNKAGAEQVNQLLKDQELIVVGENDAKETGAWPGRDGAEYVAKELADLRGMSVVWRYHLSRRRIFALT